MGDALLSIEHLSAAAGEKPILHDIDLSVGQNEIHVLMGPNGAGKSTLGQVIMGDPEYTVTSGAIKLEGADITAESVDKRSRAGCSSAFRLPWRFRACRFPASCAPSRRTIPNWG